MDESLGVILVVLALLAGVLIGVIGASDDAYKRGQLDFQRGKVEWVLAPDGAIWHKEKSE